LVKILWTTLGETGGDAVTVSMNLGYLKGALMFTAILLVAVMAQVLARKFHGFLRWFTLKTAVDAILGPSSACYECSNDGSAMHRLVESKTTASPCGFK
jgi:hypothetical protein